MTTDPIPPTPPAMTDTEVAEPTNPLIMPGCTCPWNNGLLVPGVVSGHHIGCPILKREHSAGDNCGPAGHSDAQVPAPDVSSLEARLTQLAAEAARLRTRLDDATRALSAERDRSEQLAEQRDKLYVELTKERGLRKHYEAEADEADGERAITAAHAQTLANDLDKLRTEMGHIAAIAEAKGAKGLDYIASAARSALATTEESA